MPYDDQKCAEHAEVLKTLRERTHGLANQVQTVTQDEARLKEDVVAVKSELHDAVADLHEHDVAVSRIETQLQALMGRVPVTLGADLATLTLQLKTAITDIDSVKALVKSDFVHRTEFEPVKRIVYGMVTIILTAVIVALVALVVRK